MSQCGRFAAEHRTDQSRAPLPSPRMRTRAVGGARVDRVEEHCLPIPLSLLTDDEELVARRVAPLPSGFLDRATMTFEFSNHSWIVNVDGLTVLVDPGPGNARTGRGPR